MEKFPHVVDNNLREMLENGWNGDEDTVCRALTETRKHFMQDCENEMIPADVLTSREEAIEDAEGWWNEEGNGFRAAESLRDYWRI